MTYYTGSIADAFAVHGAYRALAASPYYGKPPKACATVRSLTHWYGDDPRLWDVRTYRALAALLALAPIGGRTYLNIPLRTVAALVAAAVLAGTAIASAVPGPCVADDGGRCMTEAQYAEVLHRMDALRSERSGDRFN